MTLHKCNTWQSHGLGSAAKVSWTGAASYRSHRRSSVVTGLTDWGGVVAASQKKQRRNGLTDWGGVVAASQKKQRRNGLTDWGGVVAASQKKQRRNGLTDRSSV